VRLKEWQQLRALQAKAYRAARVIFLALLALILFALLSIKYSSAQTTVAPFATQTAWIYQTLSANVNGQVFPALCSQGSKPSWCSGSTADQWISAACSQASSTGGSVNLSGLTGNIAAPVTCGSPTRPIVLLDDNVSGLLTITESDGGIPFKLDDSSQFVGPGVGQCSPYLTGGIVLAASANIQAVFGPAHTDGTEENFAVMGACIFGAAGATVTKGMIWADRVFTNTAFNGNTIQRCQTACIAVNDVGGSMTINGNELNMLDGVNSLTGSPLVIQAVTYGNGAIEVAGNTFQAANGGGPEVNVVGNGSGVVNNGIWVHDNYIERAGYSGTTGSVNGINVEDCQSCTFENLLALGTPGGTNFVKVSQSSPGLTQNVKIANITATAWTNVLNDTINGNVYPEATDYTLDHYTVNPGYSDAPCPSLANNPSVPYLGECWTSPSSNRQFINTPIGIQQYAWQSDLAGEIQSTGADLLSGLGNFETGSGTIGTDFVTYGCQTPITCTYTRTNATAAVGTYSQEIAVTANAGGTTVGVEYNTGFAFTAGQKYLVSFWARNDGTVSAAGWWALGNPNIPVVYCQNNTPPLTSTWQLFSFICAPTASATSDLSVGAQLPAGATGTIYVDDLIFSLIQPMTTGSYLQAIGPFNVGAASTPIPGVTSVNTNTGALVLNFSAGAGSCTYSSPTTTCTITGSSTGGGTVTNVIAGTTPSWLAMSIATSTTTPTISLTASAIPNTALANSTITLGSSTLTLGGTTSTVTGLTLSAPTLSGSWTGGTPGSLTLTNATGLPWTGLTGSPSTTQVPFQSLTTTGTSGPATLTAGVLNIPQYTGTGGSTNTICTTTITLSGSLTTTTQGSLGSGTCSGATTTDTAICSTTSNIFTISPFTPSTAGIPTLGIQVTANTITINGENNTASTQTISSGPTYVCKVFR
jgi:hypothetical protein